VLHAIFKGESNVIKFMAFLLLVLSVLMFACSKDKSTTPTGPDDTATSTWVADGGYWRSLVDATSSDHYVYFSFATQDTVTLTDEQAADDDSWDIAFKRYHIKLNGGISGAQNVVGADLEEIGSDNGTDFAAVIDTSDMTGHSWVEDGYNLIVNEWYSYNPQTHQLVPTNYVYIIKDAEGKYVKFQVIGMEGGSMPPDMGSVTCRFVHAGNGTDISGVPDTVTLDVGTGTGYVDFSTGTEVTPADPSMSTVWDIAFTSYEIHMNSNLFGPGMCTAYPVYQALEDPTDFDGLTQAETSNFAYFWDELGSALTDWYDTIHENQVTTLFSKDHIYLIKSGNSVYKFKMHSYYNPNTQASGWVTFYWAELDL